MLVGDGVVGDDIGRCTFGQMLVGSVTDVERIAAVRGQRQPGDQSVQCVGQDSAGVDIAVVRRDRAADHRVLGRGTRVGHCGRRIVRAGQRDRQRAGARRTVLVGDGVVGDDVGSSALSQMLIGSIAGIERIAAVGGQRQARHRCVQGVGENGSIVDIAVVRGDCAADRGVFGHCACISNRNRRIVGARDGHLDLGGRVGAEFVGHPIAECDVLLCALRQVIELAAGVELELVADDAHRALARWRAHRGEREHTSRVDIDIVGENVDGQDLVLATGRRVGHRHRSIVGARDANAQGRQGARRAIARRIAEDVLHDLPLRQRLDVGLPVRQRIAVAAIGVERERAVGTDVGAGRRHPKHGVEVGIAVVGEHIAGDGCGHAVLDHRIAVGHGHRPRIGDTEKIAVRQVVQADQLDRQLGRARVAVDVGIHVGGIVGRVLDEPDAVRPRRVAAPHQVGASEQRDEIDLVEIGGRSRVAQALEVGDDIHRAAVRVGPGRRVVVVVTLVLVTVAVVVAVVAGVNGRTEDETVAARAAGQRVGPEAAGQFVVAGTAVKAIVALLAEQPIVAAFAEHGVVATAGIDAIVAARTGARGVVAVVTVHGVVAAACIDGVVAQAGGERSAHAFEPVAINEVATALVAVAVSRDVSRAADRVVARATVDQVVAVGAEQGVVAGTAVHGVLAVAAVEHVGAGAAVEHVVAVLAEDDVVATFTEDTVAAVAGVDDVGAPGGQAVQVVAVVAVDEVVAVAAVDGVVAGGGADHQRRVGLRREVLSVALVAVAEDDVAAVATVAVVAATGWGARREAADQVVAGAAVDRVGAAATHHRVVACAAEEQVIAAAAVDTIGTDAGVDDVVARTTRYRVVATIRVNDQVVAVGSDDRVVEIGHRVAPRAWMGSVADVSAWPWMLGKGAQVPSPATRGRHPGRGGVVKQQSDSLRGVAATGSRPLTPMRRTAR